MAKGLVGKNEVVGCRVYEPYSPKKAGVIIDDLGVKSFQNKYMKELNLSRKVRVVKVKWLTGKTSEAELSMLQDFDALIADHRKKLATHEQTLMHLNEIQVAPGE